MNIKCFIFDFDGVILESVEVKTQAFRKLFLEYPDHVDAIVDYHMEQGGVSRYKKFEYIYKSILGQELSSEKSQELGSQFADYAYQEVLDSSFVEGADVFLEKYYNKYPMYIATGTPQEEIDDVVKCRELTKYFKGVYGSPATKKEIAQKVLAEEGLEPKDAVFIGDSITDYNGALQAGVPFIGRIHPKYDNPFVGLDVLALVNNLNELDGFLSSYISQESNRLQSKDMK